MVDYKPLKKMDKKYPSYSIQLHQIVKLCMKWTCLRFIEIVMGHIYLFGFYV